MQPFKTALLWGLGAVGGAVLLYVVLLIVVAASANRTREYDKNSRFSRFFLYSATAVGLKLLRVRVHAEGLERLPTSGRFLVVGNHRSNFDPIVTWHVLRAYDLAFISKAENFRIPIFGRLIRKCCFTEIDRTDPRKAMRTIVRAASLMQKDEVSIAVYPEGTRSKEGVLLPFHNGVFKIAQKAHTPIVVVAVEGTEQIHSRWYRRRSDVYLTVAEVLPTEFICENRTAVIGERVRATLTETLK